MNWSAGRRPEQNFTLRRQGRGSLIQAAVGAFEVVFVGVIARGCIDFSQVEEEFAIQEFQAHLGMEALHMGVFPGRTRLDVTRPLIFGNLLQMGKCLSEESVARKNFEKVVPKVRGERRLRR